MEWLVGYLLIGWGTFILLFTMQKDAVDRYEEKFPGPLNPAKVNCIGISLAGALWPLFWGWGLISFIAYKIDERKNK